MARTPVKKKTAKAREQELLKLVFDLQNQQKAMEKRFSALREENKTMQEINRQQKIALSRTSPRSKQQIALSSSEDEESAAAATPSPRRSPRRRKNKRASPPARQKKKKRPKKNRSASIADMRNGVPIARTAKILSAVCPTAWPEDKPSRSSFVS